MRYKQNNWRDYLNDLKALLPVLLLVIGLVIPYLVIAPALANEAPAGERQPDDDKPLIGINMDVNEKDRLHFRILPDYTNAIIKAGGIPVMIPPVPEEDLPRLLSRLDGVMMIGGNDYPPELYGEKPDATVEKMHEMRSTFDLALARAALKDKRIPVLGICAGCQVMNIVSGGSLVQDIPSRFSQSKIRHARQAGQDPKDLVKHDVTIEPGSKLAKILPEKTLNVVSNHHQCVNKIGADLNVGARSADGVIESIECQDKPFGIGVQWHPERDYKTCEKLFQEFVKAGQKAHKERLLAGSR